MFQNQPISINKIEIPRNSSTNMPNRDTLPRLCFEIEKKDSFTYSLNIIFNDYSMVGKSSQIDTSYSFSLYIVFRDKTPNAVSKSNFKNMRNIKTESILKLDREIYANDSIFVENLTRGTYLIEVHLKKNFLSLFIKNLWTKTCVKLSLYRYNDRPIAELMNVSMKAFTTIKSSVSNAAS